ncbi:MAG: porin [Deltaproteobacteria bacterium]|nr:porin [Deltaproteobacteria bacterium]
MNTKSNRSHRMWVLVALVVAVAVPAFAEDPPSNQELHDLYKVQQEQIDATADAIDEAKSEGTGAWFEKTHLGGYGELHFNFLDGSSGAGNKSEADFHRFVLFIDHEFSDKIRLYSEIELEHALTTGDAPGEVELEQAFIEFDLPTDLTASAGLFLIPVGILNETHEPTTFYGVERNPVEKNIIPTTWWEAGGMLSRRFDRGFRTDVAVTTGLQTGRDADENFVIRGGRQKVAEANASDVAITGRVIYSGHPGLEVGVAVQWSEDVAANGENTPATLFEGHVVYENGPFGLRALYARWDLHSDSAEAVGKDEQYGFYVEPSYRIFESLGIFARYNQYNTSAGNSGGTMRQYDVGLNFWPHEGVVLKLDGQFQRNDNGAPELDGVNLGLGFAF